MLFLSIGDSASTAAAQKLIAGTESEELPPLEIPETVSLPSEGIEYSALSANQIKQVMDKLTGLVYRRIREYVVEFYFDFSNIFVEIMNF